MTLKLLTHQLFGGVRVFMGMMKWIAAVMVATLVVLAGFYVLLVAGSFRAVKYYYG